MSRRGACPAALARPTGAFPTGAFPTGAFAAAAASLALGTLASPAGAQPLRLRADALAAVESPVGLLSLEAEGELAPWLRAEAVVWMGADGAAGGDGGGDGQALIISVQARRADHRGAAKLGRMLISVGALRPLHLDGAWATVALPWRWTAEAFGGVPVAPGSSGRSFDWLAGGRAGRRLGDYGSAGVAYLQQRDRGARAFEELAFDAGAALGRRADAGARLTFDLIGWAPAELQLTTSWRRGGRSGAQRGWRLESYYSERRPSHLVPATSLFSVLGDVAARKLGGRAALTAAPRLELSGEVAVGGAVEPSLGRGLGLDGALRAELALGDRRRARSTASVSHAEIGVVSLELRRSGDREGASGWLGLRGAARLPIGRAAGGALVAAAELELVRPDDDARGALWPWALASLRWSRGVWEAAGAIEASATASERGRLDALARLTRRWEGP